MTRLETILFNARQKSLLWRFLKENNLYDLHRPIIHPQIRNFDNKEFLSFFDRTMNWDRTTENGRYWWIIQCKFVVYYINVARHKLLVNDSSFIYYYIDSLIHRSSYCKVEDSKYYWYHLLNQIDNGRRF